MKVVKDVFDLNGILNLGKMFDVFKVWEYLCLKIELLWDYK